MHPPGDYGVATAAAERLTAAHVMRRVDGGLKPGDTLARAAQRMASLGVRELAVLEEGRVVGIVAQVDLLPYRGHYEWTAVRAAMSRDVVTVAADTPLPAVAALLLERGINSVPVVDGDRCVGMVSRTDCLRPLASRAGLRPHHGNGDGAGAKGHAGVVAGDGPGR